MENNYMQNVRKIGNLGQYYVTEALSRLYGRVYDLLSWASKPKVMARNALASLIFLGANVEALANNPNYKSNKPDVQSKQADPKNKEGLEALLDDIGKTAGGLIEVTVKTLGGAANLLYKTGEGTLAFVVNTANGTLKFIGKYSDDSSIKNYKSLDYYFFNEEGKDPVYGITHQPGNFISKLLNTGHAVIIGWPSESMKRADAEKKAEGKSEEKGPVIFVVDATRFIKYAGVIAGETVLNTPEVVVKDLSEKPLDTLVSGFELYMIGDLVFKGPLTGGKSKGGKGPSPKGSQAGGATEAPPPKPPWP